MEKTITRCECCKGLDLDVTCGRADCQAYRIVIMTLPDGKEVWYSVDEYEKIIEWQKKHGL